MLAELEDEIRKLEEAALTELKLRIDVFGATQSLSEALFELSPYS